MSVGSLAGPLAKATGTIAVAIVALLLYASPAAAAGPSVTINQAVGQSDPTSTSPIEFTVTFSASVTGFDYADVDLSSSTAGGTQIVAVSGSGKNYTVKVSGMTSNGTVVASIPAGAAQDGSHNPSLASTSTDNTVTWQRPEPTVTINQGAGQSDPTEDSTIEFTASFSTPVSGFTGADVDLSGSTAKGALTATVSGGTQTYTVKVSGMTGAGTVIASIPAAAAEDPKGDPSRASTSTDNSVTWSSKTPPPTVTINQAAGQSDPTSGSTIQFTATFSAPVTGFGPSGVDLSASTATGPLSATVGGGPTVYTVSVTGMTGAGAVVASVPAGAALDAHNVSSLASTSTDHSVYWQPPAVADSGGGDAGGGTPAVPRIGPTPTAPSLRLLSACSAKRPCKTDRKGDKLALRFACAALAPCSGQATIVLHRKTLGKVNLNLAAGATATIKVPLRAAATRLLASHPKVSAQLEIRLGSASTTGHLAFALPAGHGRPR
jgi:hypothetical protein